MKNYFASALVLVSFGALILSSCKKTEECLDCKIEGLVKTTIIPDTATPNKTITVYPVMTPSNHPMCDSMAYSPMMGAYVYPYMVHKDFQKLCTVKEAQDSLKAGNDTACPCRVNPDTAFNDDKNSYFHIGGITNFPYNRLIIKTTEDTTKMRVYSDYDNKNNLFIGEVAMDTTLGYYEWNNTKPLTSGVYSYMLVLYKEEQHFTQIGDTIKGKFAIIRNDRFKNRYCKEQAFDEGDNLLK